MQVQVNTRAAFTCVLTLGFIYLAYLIFFRSDEDFPEIDVNLRDIISYAVLAVEMGGHAVSQIYAEKALLTQQKGLTDEGKAELLTQADLISNYLILDVLKRFPKLEIVSEEKDGSVTDKEAERYRSDKYALWLSVRDLIDKMPERRLPLSDLRIYVDPLDATQEFTEGLTQYVTVMVCIVSGDEPIFGAIYRPFFNQTLFGISNWGIMNEKGQRVTPVSAEQTPKNIVVSRSHAGTVKEFATKAFGDGYTVEPAGGSGYKTWRLVNGTAELYVHTTAIKKWDTCAGDAILRASGGAMLDLRGDMLKYGKDSEIVNKRGLLVTIRTPYTFYQKLRPYVEKTLTEEKSAEVRRTTMDFGPISGRLNYRDRCIVPCTISEWELVVELLQKTDVKSLEDCVDILNAWSCRMGRQLPVALAITEVLLRAIVTDGRSDPQSVSAWETVKLTYSTAIIRFVNYVSEAETKRAGNAQSITQTVVRAGVEPWVVAVRHNATHEHMPPMSELRRAAEFCRRWMWENYWCKPCTEAMNLVMGRRTEEEVSNEKLEEDKEPLVKLIDFVHWRNSNLHRILTFEEMTKLPWYEPLVDIIDNRTSDFLFALTMEGVLIRSDFQLKKENSEMKEGETHWIVPSSLQHFWQPLFVIFKEKRLIGEFLLKCLNMLGGKNEPHVDYQLLGWASQILNAFIEAGLSSPDSMTMMEWRRTLQALLVARKHFDKETIKKVIELVPIAKKRKRQLHRLLDIDMSESLMLVRESYSIKTLADLQKLMKKEDEELRPEEEDWVLEDPHDWAGIPLGLTPNQTAESLNLMLDMDERNAAKTANLSTIQEEDEDS